MLRCQMRRSIFAATLGAVGVAATAAFGNSGPHLTNWTDRAAFEAALESATTLDFAGVPNTNYTSAEVLAGVGIGGGVTMTAATTLPDPPDDGDLRIRNEALDLILINIPIDASIETITFDLPHPVLAFGADYDFDFGRSGVLFTALGTAIDFAAAMPANTGFFGVTSDTPFSSVTLSLAFPDTDPPIIMDNLTFAATLVPEPASVVSVVLAGALLLRRRG